MSDDELVAVQGKIPCLFETKIGIPGDDESKCTNKKVEQPKKENIVVQNDKNSKKKKKRRNWKKGGKSKDIVVSATKDLREEIQDMDDKYMKNNLKYTEKVDGTCCLIRDNWLWRRYDRKLNKIGEKKRSEYKMKLQQWIRKEIDQKPENIEWDFVADFKDAPEGWVPAENIKVPDENGHQVGWVKIDKTNPSDKWHASVIEDDNQTIKLLRFVKESDEGLILNITSEKMSNLNERSFELIGNKVNANAYGFSKEFEHYLVQHGEIEISKSFPKINCENKEKYFDILQEWFDMENTDSNLEGVVIHDIKSKNLYKVHRGHIKSKRNWPFPVEKRQCRICEENIIGTNKE